MIERSAPFEREGIRSRLACVGAWLTAISALLVLPGCGGTDDAATARSTPAALSGIRYLAGGDEDGDFARAREPREFVFPADHGSHPAFRTEWWYFTGNLFDARERHYGFELTLFRIALSGAAPARDSALASNQIWMANLAVTDTQARTFHAAERLSRDATGIAGAVWNPAPAGTPSSSAAASGDRAASAPVPAIAEDARLTLRVEDWSIVMTGDAARLVATEEDFGIDLALEGLGRIVRQGDRGLDAKGPEPGNASYYYSAPRLSASGRVVTADSPPVEVQGSAWMDREWSTSALSPSIAGWDWFALQLDDGRDLMFYRLRGDDGSTSAFSGGTIADAGGNVERIDADAVGLTATRHWRSPVTQVRYPVAWRLEVPDSRLALEIEPRLDDQELDLSVRYWEGAVSVIGTSAGQRIGGVGYVELAGY